ncbi:glutathione S-transferase [Microbulbifer flavimaris]|uniref:Glutathione S-transferase n=1 Tax=Microbulbifer flavimaris TaxID=1781068 RepID=A0ABX4I430_9GAMM|nr:MULTISPECIES: glutathione S-transferase family protein [Microbulbifer]KUJ84568.1 glutathione S-transferase [Microbulbifer sp. ZGT114]PCO06655.1 glutathione S-transferase [Microbulbifer flavimaris]
MYRLFIGNKNYSSWSLRPWILLRQLSIPFDEQLVPFDEGNSWEKFRNFAPNGLVPCLEDGDVTVWDSLAIVEYIAERYPQVWPQSAVARAWARCATAEMHSGFAALREQCPMNCGATVSLDAQTPALQKDLHRIAELWQQGLQRFGGPFLAGDQFTAVDAFFAPVALRVKGFGLPLPEGAAAYAQRLLQLPAMDEWVGEALREPWRESGHEGELLQSGTLIEDRRVPRL